MQKDEIKRSAIIAIVQAIKGKYIWYFLKYKFIKCEKFIIFPMEDQDYNAWGIVMLRAYLDKEKLNRVVIVANDKKIANAINYVSINNAKIQFLKPKHINCLMKYYALVDMSQFWTVVSVTTPYDTGAERLLGIKEITKKEIVYYDIYGFSCNNIEAEIGRDMYKVNEIEAILKE